MYQGSRFSLLRLILNRRTLFCSTLLRHVNPRAKHPGAMRWRWRRLRPVEAWEVVATLVLAAALLLGACTPDAPSEAQMHAWQEEVETWHRERLERLQSEDGWLTLVGLSWLHEGANTIGAAQTNDLVFPVPGGPDMMGTFHLSEGSLRVEIEDAAITHDGEALETLTMDTDVQGEPTVLRRGTLSFYAVRRGDRTAIRIKDSASPIRSEFSGIDRFALDPAWRLEGRFEPSPEGTTLPIPNSLGGHLDQSSPGTIYFDMDGQPQRIDALEGGPSGRLFLVFGDQTNSDTTYGGGRFLYADPPAEDGSVTLDFNRAYNPPCVFTRWATCPLPPPQNRMGVKVEAGELIYSSH